MRRGARDGEESCTLNGMPHLLPTVPEKGAARAPVRTKA